MFLLTSFEATNFLPSNQATNFLPSIVNWLDLASDPRMLSAVHETVCKFTRLGLVIDRDVLLMLLCSWFSFCIQVMVGSGTASTSHVIVTLDPATKVRLLPMSSLMEVILSSTKTSWPFDLIKGFLPTKEKK